MSDPVTVKELLEVEYHAITSRGISVETCRGYRYGIGKDKAGNTCHVATYTDSSGVPCAQKLRGANKSFSWLGRPRNATLFGQSRFRGGGRRVYITEGELDALSVAEVLPGWPSVSVPNGASGAKASLAKNLEWVSSFESIVLVFDGDEPGRKAAEECAELLPPGKVHIVKFSPPYKDASDLLQAGKREELRKLVMFNAEPYRPDGIVEGSSELIRDYVVNFEPKADAHYPWALYDSKMFGMRKGELVLHTSGTGMGKSTIVGEIAYNLGVKQNKRVGILALEESVNRYGLRIFSIDVGMRCNIIGCALSPSSREEIFKRSIGNGNFFLYDHWGSANPEVLMSKIRYLIKGCGCEWIILDHLSIVTSGVVDSNERQNIDYIMSSLKAITEERPAVGIHLVSHLSRKASGESHENGAQIELRDLRGSHSIGQLSDIVLAYERDQQSAEEKNVITVRKLKDRYAGETGIACKLLYNSVTGRVEAYNDNKPVATLEGDSPF